MEGQIDGLGPRRRLATRLRRSPLACRFIHLGLHRFHRAVQRRSTMPLSLSSSSYINTTLPECGGDRRDPAPAASPLRTPASRAARASPNRQENPPISTWSLPRSPPRPSECGLGAKGWWLSQNMAQAAARGSDRCHSSRKVHLAECFSVPWRIKTKRASPSWSHLASRPGEV